MLAGNVPVVQRSSSELPIESIAFVGAAGDTVNIRIAENISDESAIANMAGFIDRASNTLRNSSSERLTNIARHAFLLETLEADAASIVPNLTANQRVAYTTERDAFAEVPPMAESYALNQNPVRLSIINAETGEALRETLDLSMGETFSVTLPRTGWYILHKTYLPSETVANGLTLLDVHGIYPVLQSSSFDSESGNFVDDYVRMTDGLRLREALPQIEGTAARYVNIVENKYYGARSFGDYLSAYLAPFLNSIGLPIVSYFVLGIAGYWFTLGVARFAGKNLANNLAALLLILQPVLFWILVNGMLAFTALNWLLVLALLSASLFIYQLGRRTGHNILLYLLPALVYAALVYVLLLSHEFDFWEYLRLYTLLLEPAGLPRFILWLGFIPLFFAAYSGAKARIIGDKNQTNWLWLISAIIFFVIATALLIGNPVLSSIAGQSLPITLETTWPLQPSSPNDWGGLLLVMAITIYGIIIAFPIGVALALGRRSELPIIKSFCIGYVEIVRGAPFITVLFFVQLLLPLLSSELNQLSNTYRAIIATILFSAAYLAENVRGGLQSLPPGQSEAAKALGLSAWQMTTLVTMPQALRAVIPALVGQFIGLFKDTSLVSIVNLIDLVKVVDSINAQTAFSSTRLEGLFFISIIYFVFSYVMAYISRLLEASGSGVTRRM